MPVRILLVRFKLDLRPVEYEHIAAPLMSAILDASGLRWKIWLVDATRKAAGGIYLFDDEPSVQAFLAGPTLTELVSHPAVSSVLVEQFDIMEGATMRTHGPIRYGMRV